MTISAFYHHPKPRNGRYSQTKTLISYWFDNTSMTVLPITDRLVVAYLEAGGVIGAYVAPDDVQPSYRLFKSVFIGRLTNEEAAVMEAVLASADAKLRLMFNSVEFFVSDDPLFETLLAAVGGVLGPARAEELLAPEQ